MSTLKQGSPALLITGAAGGMGRACALQAAREGLPLILADLSAERLEKLAGECVDEGGQARCVTLDVTEEAATEAMLETLPQGASLGGIIHTVGLSPQMADWRRIIDVDLVSSVALLEQLRPRLQPGAAAICIASMSAYMGPPDEVVDALMAEPLAGDFAEKLELAAEQQPLLQDSGMAYSWAKRSLKRWVANRAAAWGAEGKRLVSISPGLIDTDMGRLENDAMGEERFAQMRERISLGRLGTADDIAHAALFLASAKAAYITGCDLLVDGGFVARLQEAQG